MIGARDEPEVASFHRRVIERARHREATVFRGGNARVARIDAAVANAVAADWLELDEGYRPTPCHAGLYILPSLLATAETEDRSCGELLRAIVLGYEVVTRIARGWKQRALNMQSHGRYSAIGAASATSLLQRLDAGTMFNAGTAAAPLVNPSPRTHLVAGALVRHVWPAQGAWSRLMAVEWAGCGIAGARHACHEVHSDVVGGMREKVRVKPYEDARPPPNDRPARAEVKLRDGRVLSAECLSARGGADRPLPPSTVDDKLAQLAAPVYPAIAGTLAPIRALDAEALQRGWRQTVDAFVG